MLMIRIVVQCNGIKLCAMHGIALLMIRIVVLLWDSLASISDVMKGIGIALLMISCAMQWSKIAHDNESCAMH